MLQSVGLGLIVISIALTLRPAGSNSPSAGDERLPTSPAHRREIRHARFIAAASDSNCAAPPAAMPRDAAPDADTTHATETRRREPPSVVSKTPTSDEPNGSPAGIAVEQAPALPPVIAIQLATDVRLPAAIVPMNQEDMPPAVAAAVGEIGSQFYRDLFAVATHPQAGQVTPQQVDDTAIIPNGPVTNHLRQSADERFRALFGDEKYIQHNLASAIEVMLPLSD